MRSAYILFSWVWKNSCHHLLPDCIGLLLCILVGSLCNITLPFFFKSIIDQMNVAVLSTHTLTYALLLYAGWYGFNRFLEGARFFFLIRFAQKSTRILSTRIFEHLHQLPYQFHTSHRIGDITTIVNGGISAFTELLRFFLLSFVPLTIELVSAFVLLALFYSFPCLLIILFFCLLYSGTMLLGNNWIDQYRKKVRDIRIKRAGFFADTLLNYTTVKFSSKEEAILQRYRNTTQDLEQAIYNTTNKSILISWTGATIISGALFAVLRFTGQEVIQGHFVLGDFVMVHLYLMRFINPLQRSALAYRSFKEGTSQVAKLGALLSQTPNITKGYINPFPDNFQPSISFQEVSFSYAYRPLLQKLSFELNPGETLGILGPSGTGKSSIINLLLGLITPQSGKIYLGNYPIQSLNLAQLRKHIAIAPQDVLLFNDTIAYNITLGAANVEKKEIEQVARLTGIHHTICGMSQGYDSYVGERGSKLSGGERKRLGIARALIKPACIYVFDEPTSFLDEKNAADIRKTIRKIRAKKTCIIISHNSSDLDGVDQLLVL